MPTKAGAAERALQKQFVADLEQAAGRKPKIKRRVGHPVPVEA